MWWWAMGCLTAACLALASVRHRRRRAQRVRIDRIRELVDELPLSAALTPAYEVPASPSSAGPRTPDGTTDLEPPTEISSPSRACAVRPRRRVVLSASDLSATLAPPRWRLR